MSSPILTGIPVNTILTRRQQIVRSLEDKEGRDAFVAEHITTGIAFQIRAMREDRRWSQEELGRRSSKAQTEISRLENPDLSNYTLGTLKRLASAFGVALIVRFAPFSKLVDYAVGLSAEDIRVPAFEHDEWLHPTGFIRDLSVEGVYTSRTDQTEALEFKNDHLPDMPLETPPNVVWFPLIGQGGSTGDHNITIGPVINE